MKTINVNDATLPQLDELVAKGLGWEKTKQDAEEYDRPEFIWTKDGVFMDFVWRWRPTTNWSQMGPILDEIFSIYFSVSVDNKVFCILIPAEDELSYRGKGDEKLEAAARAFVAWKFGEEVEVDE